MCGLVNGARKLVISGRPSRKTKPTGCCMKQLAIRIQRAERWEPIGTSQVAAAWVRLESRSHPKTQMPRKVDSRKNASKVSMADGTPKISPTKREYSD